MDPEVKWRLDRAREYGRAARDAFLKQDYANADKQQEKQDETIADLQAYLNRMAFVRALLRVLRLLGLRK